MEYDVSVLRARAVTHLGQLSNRIAVLDHEAKRLTADRDSRLRQQERYLAQGELFAQAISILNQIVEAASTANLKILTDLVNSALKEVFFDLDLEFRVVSDVKWEKTVYRFEVVHDGVTGNRFSQGGSIYAIIALVLKVVFNRFARRYPLIVLDETLRFVEEKYVAETSRALRSLSDKLGINFVLVTHDPALAAEAEHNYRATLDPKGTTFQDVAKYTSN